MKLREAPIPEVEEAGHDSSESPAQKHTPASDQKDAADRAMDGEREAEDSEGATDDEAEVEAGEGDVERGPKEVHHCPVCSITTTSAAHLEVRAFVFKTPNLLTVRLWGLQRCHVD